jgi:hypothetical protein
MVMSSKSLGNFFKHDFRGAAADCLYAGVPRHSLDGAFAHEAHPAMKLHAIVHHSIDQFTAIGLPSRPRGLRRGPARRARRRNRRADGRLLLRPRASQCVAGWPACPIAAHRRPCAS